MADEMMKATGVPRRGRADLAVIDATTEEDVDRHMAEDGFDPADPLASLVPSLSPGEIRRRAGLTQTQMAEHLRIPVATWRNWEQGRTALDPATRSFLDTVANDTERTFRAIAGRTLADQCDGQLDGMMRTDDAQFLMSFARGIIDRPERGAGSNMPIPNEGARLQRLRLDPTYGRVVALLEKMAGL